MTKQDDDAFMLEEIKKALDSEEIYNNFPEKLKQHIVFLCDYNARNNIEANNNLLKCLTLNYIQMESLIEKVNKTMIDLDTSNKATQIDIKILTRLAVAIGISSMILSVMLNYIA